MSVNDVKKESFGEVRKDRNKPTLIRLFDIESNELKELSTNNDENIPLSSPAEEGTFGVWQWTAVPNSKGNNRPILGSLSITKKNRPHKSGRNDNNKPLYHTNVRKNNVIEIIVVPGVSSIEDLVKKMGIGISEQPVCSRVLFCIDRSSGDIEGVLCQDDQFIKSTNGKTCILDSVNDLPVYTIDVNDILRPKRSATYEKRFYRKLKLAHSGKTVPVKKLLETAKNTNESLTTEKNRNVHQNKISEIEKNQTELKAFAQEIVSCKKKLLKLKDAVLNQERLLTDFSEKVKEKIEEARKDVASFVSEMLLISAIKGSENNSIAQTPILLKGSKIDTEERNNDYKDAIMSLATDLKNVGIARDYSRAFAAFLYSAYINHVPVLLAGPNARDISDAFSAALFGKTAGVIDCSGPYRTEVINEITESDDEIFTIKNALRNEWITHVPELLSLESKYFFIAHPFAEDLLIEPKTLFTYTMPILTELIVTAKPKGQLAGAVRSSDFEEYQKKDIEAQKDLERVLKSLGTGTLVRSQLQSVLADFHSMHSEERDLDCLFAVFPYAYISGLPLRQAFEMLTGKMGISKDLSEELKSFIGISDE